MQIGIDEVGRGCLAGPLVVGAVSLKKPIKGLKDSKLLSKVKRIELARLIYAEAESASLGWAWPHEIDSLGLTQAMTLAIKRALSQITGDITSIIIDGNYNYLSGNPLVKTIIKADTKIACVSAASIIAKAARDEYMSVLAQYFPEYGFGSHVGYGTQSHMSVLKRIGPCAIHRLSFSPVREVSFNSL